MEERKFHVGIKAFILNDKNEVLVLKTNAKELKGGTPVHWDLPGGRIKEGDSAEATLRKEVEEELGVDGSDLEIVRPFDGVLTDMEIPVGEERVGLVLFVYLCRLPKKDIRLSFEHTEFKWASMEEAKKLLAFKFGKDFVDKLDGLKLMDRTKWTYIVVDVETTCWRVAPGEHSMISLGACVAFNRGKTFYVELQPLNDNYDESSMKVNRLSLSKLRKEGKLPQQAMSEFEAWVKQVSAGKSPVFVASPAHFDWPWVAYYFDRFLGRNPFERRVLDMRSYFAGKFGLGVEGASRDALFSKYPPTVTHTHNALDDVKGYAEVFEKLLGKPKE